MGSDPGVIEISSDEEDFGLDELDDASYNWISELLDGETAGFDDVVVVDEFSTPTAMRNHNLASSRPKRGALRDDPDDDCLVLDADPDNPVLVVDNKTGGGDGLDELLIVGEKGQLACRDYPHSRHLCANFPFSTTLHEKHCDMCHCYVCDSPAPCIYWSNDVSGAGHCHSTDKEGKWKALRKSFKQRNTDALQQQNPRDTTLSMMPPLQNPVSIHRSFRISLPAISPNSRTLRHCPATNVATQDPISQGHHQRPIVLTYRGKRLGQHPTGSQPLIPGTQYIQREKRGADTFAAQIMHSHAKFRRVETSGNGLNGNTTVQFQNGVSHHNQVYRAPPQQPQWPPAGLVEENMKQWQDLLRGVADELGVSDGINKSSTSVQPQAVSSQSSAFSQYLSATNASQDVDTYVHSAIPRINQDSLDFDCNWADNSTTAQNIAEFAQAEDPQSATLQPSNPSVSGEIHLDAFLATVGQDPLPGAGKEHGLSELDPATLLYDFDSTWSSIAQV